ncbi:hypothetical protein [Leifsonia aquatica]|uniref:hypothetical protein n=1 Tax=Leifsonia aquatica TaxID=144185 RepID=UPI000468BAC4|nr:hypothetical protein [Leifsonia aquatica]
MSDSTEQEPVVGHDPTNGLAGDLHGDDGGSAEPTADQNMIQDVIGDLDPDRVDDAGEDDAVTPYSEEGAP